MELNGEIHRCHRCTFSICRLLPPLLPAAFLFYPPVFAYSLHSILRMDPPWIISVRGFSVLPGFLLVVRPAGSFFGGSPYGPGGGEGGENKGWNMSGMALAHSLPLKQPRLSQWLPISDISKESGGQTEKSRQKRFNKGFPPLLCHYGGTHIDWASLHCV